MATHAVGQYLKQLGINKALLTPEELACLDRDGYVSLGCLLDGQQLAEIHTLIDEFTVDNGATRVVPGTHLSNNLPDNVSPDPYASHPLEKILVAPAGTVVVFNSDLWHGGTINNSCLPRRAIHSYYCQYNAPQQVDQRRYLRPETAERLDSSILTLLDVDEPRRA